MEVVAISGQSGGRSTWRIPGSSLINFFYSIFTYREYLKQSVARDLRKKYKRSVLGYVWSMLNPLLMMVILAVVFSNIMKRDAKSYMVFLFSGILCWQFFSGTVNQSLTSIRTNMNIISQVPVPKYIFAVSIAFSNLTNFFLSLIPLILVMIVIGRPCPVTILALPIVLLPLFTFSMGIALLFATANVFFEDMKHLSGVILQAGYFLCPILYARENLPEWLLSYLLINPLFSIIEFNRGLLYDGVMPGASTYFLVLGGSFLALWLSLWTFHKSDDKFHYFV